MDAFTYEYLQSVSQSVSVLSSFKCSSDGVFKRKCLTFNGETIPRLSHLKKIKGMKSTCGLVIFIDMNTYILTKGRNFKTFLKKNYAIAFVQLLLIY